MIKSGRNIKAIILTLAILTGATELFAQRNQVEIEGWISYITGENIYVKFESTNGIENGDTLFMRQNENLIPVLTVQHHSSISCLCNSFTENTLSVSDTIVAKISVTRREAVAYTTPPEDQPEQDVNEQVITSMEKIGVQQKKAKSVTGRLSLSSYSNLTNNSLVDDVHRFRYTLSMNASKIADSKISAETYISFTHKANQWNVVEENLNNALKIYSLAIQFDIDKTTSVWAGRKINPSIANVGAVDGIQFEKRFNKFFMGAVGGTRPDYEDYGLNFNLLEYGAYIGQKAKLENGFAQTSLAFFEMRNNGAIDRRFLYFQHSNSAAKNLNMFSSFEVDLYKLEDGEPKTTLDLISLYISLRYRFSRKFSIFGSYDNRKNVIYNETFRSFVDEIIQQANRQGFRARMNYRPLKYINLGLSGGTRFREEDPRPTNTFRGYVTHSKIPTINASLTLSANLMETSYLDGQVYGARLSKDLIGGKLFSMLNYRYVNYKYVSTASSLVQNIAEIDLSYYITKKLFVSLNFESTFQDNENYNRIYFNLRKKF
jgi:hypothetical protein